MGNLNHYILDSLEQYDRLENLQIYNIPETAAKNDDSLEILLKVANELNIELDEKDVQRTQRLGIKTESNHCSLHQQQNNEFLYKKSSLKESSNYENAYIAED